jgi:hypothetical protein
MAQLLVSGRPVTFGTAGNYKEWAETGWSQDQDQPEITWMDGLTAGLEFMMPVPSVDLLMSARLMPFVAGGLKQYLQIYLNGLFVDLWAPAANEFREYSTLIKKSYFAKETLNTVTFVAPHATSPEEAKISPDRRRLSFAFMQLSLQDPTRRARVA